MADRVAIIGGNTAGRDHFPFPIKDIGSETGGFYTDVGDGRFHPAVIGLSEAAQWCYLVKKWHFELTCDYSVGYGDGSLAGSAALSFDYVHKWTPHEENDVPGDNVLPTRESDLVLPRWGALGPNGVITLRFNNFVNLADAPGDFDITNVSSSVSNDDGSGEDLLLLSFTHEVFGSRFSSWASGLAPSVLVNLATTERTVTSGYLETDYFSSTVFSEDAGTFTIGSISVPLKEDGAGAIPFLHYRELTNVFVSITPLEFWPYATKAGAPVYDTSTGEQLADPFS